MKTKLFTTLLSLTMLSALLLSLIGCGGGKKEEEYTPPTGRAQQTPR
jgi:hypothetical protein